MSQDNQSEDGGGELADWIQSAFRDTLNDQPTSKEDLAHVLDRDEIDYVFVTSGQVHNVHEVRIFTADMRHFGVRYDQSRETWVVGDEAPAGQRRAGDSTFLEGMDLMWDLVLSNTTEDTAT